VAVCPKVGASVRTANLGFPSEPAAYWLKCVGRFWAESLSESPVARQRSVRQPRSLLASGGDFAMCIYPSVALRGSFVDNRDRTRAAKYRCMMLSTSHFTIRNVHGELVTTMTRSNRLLMLLGDFVTLKPCCMFQCCRAALYRFSQSICDGVGIEIIYQICRFVQPCFHCNAVRPS